MISIKAQRYIDLVELSRLIGAHREMDNSPIHDQIFDILLDLSEEEFLETRQYLEQNSRDDSRHMLISIFQSEQ